MNSFKFLFIPLLLLPLSLSAQQQSFETWLEALRVEARQLGIKESTLDLALADARPLARVIELDQSQPEFTQTFSRYMDLHISRGRIARGRTLLREHSALLNRIQNQFGVQPHYLVSFWALESNFGRFTGGFSVINALVTLAYDPRRNKFFRQELLTALKIIDDGHIAAERMSGSWAGAMGQLQFLPSTFARFAIDGDGDGRIDIWNSLPDVFASAANYLAQSGWKGDERWGREVLLPKGFDYSLSGTKIRKTVNEWRDLGITQVNSSTLPRAEMSGSILLPSGIRGPAFLVYDNFRTTMIWNRSIFYAISIGHLTDRFTGGVAIQNMPTNERALSRDEVIELQQRLNEIGLNAGPADGILGSQTRSAIREFQQQNQLPMDGYASFDVLKALRL